MIFYKTEFWAKYANGTLTPLLSGTLTVSLRAAAETLNALPIGHVIALHGREATIVEASIVSVEG